MKLVFISGKFTAPSQWLRSRNVIRAEEAGVQVANLGAMPQIPHTNSANMVGVQDWGFWMKGCLEWLSRCDAVLFLPGWADSKGAVLEHGKASELDKPRFYDIPALKEWIDHG